MHNDLRSAMIIEERSYVCYPGKTTDFLQIYQDGCLEIQTQILGCFIGMWETDIGGELSEVVHMWGYKNMQDRDRRRARLFKNKTFIANATPLLECIMTMKNRILLPASFSPLGGSKPYKGEGALRVKNQL